MQRINLCVSLFCLLVTPYSFAQAYRCTLGDGSVQYQDRRCSVGVSTPVPTTKSLNTQSGLRESEKQWLKIREKTKPKPHKKKSTKAATLTKQRQAEKCWQKRKQLTEVKARLRRGYKPAQGDVLRRKRSAYEDYLRQFCA